MGQQNNIGRLFLDMAEQNPDRIAIKLVKSELSYSQVRNLAIAFALRLRDLGVGRKSCVALDTTHPSIAAASLLAVALLGGRWVQATKSAIAEKRLGITHVLHDGSNPYPTRPGIVRVDQSWSAPPAHAASTPATFEGYDSEDDTWMYSQSSGTTGIPKIMGVSYRTFVKRLQSTIVDEVAGNFVFAAQAPPAAPNGATAFCRIGLAAGTCVVGGDYAFMQAAGVTVVGGTPVQHSKRLEGATPPTGNKIAMGRVGGAKATPAFLSLMFQFYDRVSIGYGSTEAGPVCARLLTHTDTDVEELGPPRWGAEVEIVDPQDNARPPGTEGIVRVRTNYMVSSYVSGGEASSAAFRQGWFYPGDIGRLSPSGSLKITGRVNDQLSIGGVKVNALVIDRVLEMSPDITDGFSFVEPDRNGVPILCVVVALRDGSRAERVADEIRTLCAQSISKAVVPTHVYVADLVPRNPNGKATRHLAPDLAGQWRKY